MTTYRIKQWNDVFEDFRSREVKRLRFLPFDLSRKSEAYRMLVASRAGVSAYGVFWALVIVAAHCPTRGVLSDDKGPLTPRRLAVRTGISEECIQDGLDVLTDPEIGWVEVVGQDSGTIDEPSTPETETPTAHRRFIDEPPTKPPPNTDGASTKAPRDTDAVSTPRARAQNSTEQNRTVQKQEELLSLTRDEKSMRADLDAALDRIPNSELEHALKHYPKWPNRPGFAYDAASDAVLLIAARDNTSWREALQWLGERIKAYAAAKKGGHFILAPDKWLKGRCYDENEENWKERHDDGSQQTRGSGASSPTPRGRASGEEAAAERRKHKAVGEYSEPSGTGGIRVLNT